VVSGNEKSQEARRNLKKELEEKKKEGEESFERVKRNTRKSV